MPGGRGIGEGQAPAGTVMLSFAEASLTMRPSEDPERRYIGERMVDHFLDQKEKRA